MVHFGRQSTYIDFSTSDTKVITRDIRATAQQQERNRRRHHNEKVGFATIVASRLAAAPQRLLAPRRLTLVTTTRVQDGQQRAFVGW